MIYMYHTCLLSDFARPCILRIIGRSVRRKGIILQICMLLEIRDHKVCYIQFKLSKCFFNFYLNVEIKVDVSLTVMGVLAKFQATLTW